MTTTNELSSKDLVFQAARLASDKKAHDIKVIDIRSVTDVSEYLLIVSGDTQAQLKAIANNIEDTFAKQDMEPVHVEGKTNAKWVLYDYGGFVIHIMEAGARAFYGLEEFWGHAIFVDPQEWEKE